MGRADNVRDGVGDDEGNAKGGVGAKRKQGEENMNMSADEGGKGKRHGNGAVMHEAGGKGEEQCEME